MPESNRPNNRLYLASQSPRRLELLRLIGFAPEMLQADVTVDETPLPNEAPADYVLRLARTKAQAGEATRIAHGLPPLPVLAADTTVSLDGRILEKPRDADEARRWLAAYAARGHQVYTGVTVVAHNRMTEALSSSDVHFRALSDDEIEAYLASDEPWDKAGGYGIQGRAAAFVAHLSGSHSGVMGLPLCETAQLLREAGLRT
jgi:septum formation protein